MCKTELFSSSVAFEWQQAASLAMRCRHLLYGSVVKMNSSTKMPVVFSSTDSWTARSYVTTFFSFFLFFFLMQTNLCCRPFLVFVPLTEMPWPRMAGAAGSLSIFFVFVFVFCFCVLCASFFVILSQPSITFFDYHICLALNSAIIHINLNVLTE